MSLFPYPVDMNTHTEIDIQKLEADILLSIQSYEAVLKFLQKIEKEIGTASSAALLDLNTSLTDLQAKATLIDQSLSGGKVEQTPPALLVLDKKRQGLIAEIRRVNKRVTEKAKTVRSYLAFKIKKIRTGHLIMNGYGQYQRPPQGRIVNSSC